MFFIGIYPAPFVNLSNPTGASIADGQGIGLITDDDTAGTVQFSSATYSVNESGGTVTITNSGVLTIAAAGDMTLDGAFNQNGAGAVSAAGEALQMLPPIVPALRSWSLAK